MRLTERTGRLRPVAAPRVRLRCSPQDIALEKRAGRDGSPNGRPSPRMVVALGSPKLGHQEGRLPFDFAAEDRVQLGQPSGRGPIAIDDVPRGPDGTVGTGRVPGGPGTRRDICSRLDGNLGLGREEVEIVTEAVDPLQGGREGVWRVPSPHLELQFVDVQVVAQVQVGDADLKGARGVKFRPGGDEIPAGDLEVGTRESEMMVRPGARQRLFRCLADASAASS